MTYIDSQDFNTIVVQCRDHAQTLNNLKMQLNTLNAPKSTRKKLDDIVFSKEDPNKMNIGSLNLSEREACAVVYSALAEYWKTDFSQVDDVAKLYKNAVGLYAISVNTNNPDSIKITGDKIREMQTSIADLYRDAGIHFRGSASEHEKSKMYFRLAQKAYTKLEMDFEVQEIKRNYLDRKTKLTDWQKHA